MPREKELYRENLVRLDAAFPGRDLIRLTDAAKYVGADVKTLRAAKDFPKRRLGQVWVIPKTALASWLS